MATIGLAFQEGRASGGGSSAFLCYGRFPGSQPGVWPYARAESLYRPTDLAIGFYFRPYALEGTAPEGTNLGSWHLACSLPLPAPRDGAFYLGSGEYVGGSGELYDRATGIAIVRTLYPADALGMYPVYRLHPCGCLATP